MKFALLWIVAAGFYLALAANSDFRAISIIFPLLFCSFSIVIFRRLRPGISKISIAYLLYFSTGIFTLFGLINPLTGSVNESPSVLLFGFSFYTLSLAYLAINSDNPSLVNTLKIANPALLSTGPIALFIKNYSYRKIHHRVNYYLPFFIIGFFLFHIVGVPLVSLFDLIHATDSVSSILFAIIFELFLYANFCGLSLMLYGLFGIAGYKIPLNFKQPFSSSNIIDFWRGWHLSLTAVLKLLFYIPLRKHFPPSIALLGVFLASAMWHGVTLNFLIWGLFHTLIFIVTIFLLKRNIPILPSLVLIICLLYTSPSPRD